MNKSGLMTCLMFISGSCLFIGIKSKTKATCGSEESRLVKR